MFLSSHALTILSGVKMNHFYFKISGLNCKNLHFTFQTMSAEMLMGVDRGPQTILNLSSPQFLAGNHHFRPFVGNNGWIPANCPRE